MHTPRRALSVVAAASVLGAPLAVAAPSDTGSATTLPAAMLVSAHRGGAAYAPENTMLAFRNAVRIGADQLETDSTLTKDGVLVLIHDSTLDRTTNCTGSVSDYTFSELQKCDAGYWWTPGQNTTSPKATAPHPLRGRGVTVPAAKELFGYVAGLGTHDKHTINIEIKDPDFVAPAQALVALIADSGLRARTIVQSFYPPALSYVKMLDPSITTALLTTGTTAPYLAYATTGHEWISSSYGDLDLNAATVAAVHAAGHKIIPWTPDTRSDLTATGLLGVDGLITNHPACLLMLEGRRVPSQLLPKLAVRAGSPPVPVCAAEIG